MNTCEYTCIQCIHEWVQAALAISTRLCLLLCWAAAVGEIDDDDLREALAPVNGELAAFENGNAALGEVDDDDTLWEALGEIDDDAPREPLEPVNGELAASENSNAALGEVDDDDILWASEGGRAWRRLAARVRRGTTYERAQAELPALERHYARRRLAARVRSWAARVRVAQGAPLCEVCGHTHYQGVKCTVCGHLGLYDSVRDGPCRPAPPGSMATCECGPQWCGPQTTPPRADAVLAQGPGRPRDKAPPPRAQRRLFAEPSAADPPPSPAADPPPPLSPRQRSGPLSLTSAPPDLSGGSGDGVPTMLSMPGAPSSLARPSPAMMPRTQGQQKLAAKNLARRAGRDLRRSPSQSGSRWCSARRW